MPERYATGFGGKSHAHEGKNHGTGPEIARKAMSVNQCENPG